MRSCFSNTMRGLGHIKRMEFVLGRNDHVAYTNVFLVFLVLIEMYYYYWYFNLYTWYIFYKTIRLRNSRRRGMKIVFVFFIIFTYCSPTSPVPAGRVFDMLDLVSRYSCVLKEYNDKIYANYAPDIAMNNITLWRVDGTEDVSADTERLGRT